MTSTQSKRMVIVPITPGWTPCTPECQHAGPYRVHCLDYPDSEPGDVGPEGAPVSIAFMAPPGRIYVEAPRHD